MGQHDIQSVRTEADILARQSRPQRNSTWVPKTRDWRYATGVIQHDDFQDTPKARSVWDTMDYDYQAGGDKMHQVGNMSRSGNEAVSGQSMADTTPEDVQTPGSRRSRTTTLSLKSGSQSKPSHTPMSLRKGVWASVISYKRSESSTNDTEEGEYEATGLKIRLRFTGKYKMQVREVLDRIRPTTPTPSPIDCRNPSAISQTPTPAACLSETPATARTADTLCTPHMLDSIESIYNFPLFKRVWIDETYDFNMDAVRSTLRVAGAQVDGLGTGYKWYENAVPIDAIFPPGVPISAKEINAFYPHHVRWKGVMIRLSNNGFKGADIMGMQAHFRGPPTHRITPANMNGFQRDVFKGTIPDFKSTTYQGKPDRNLRTDGLLPGTYIESKRKGYSLPTFEDLARGLQHLPTGLDARGMTQCVSWYINSRDLFTPKLELNVLHAQSLIRALRQPLKPFGPQNLDRNALKEWRNKGKLEELEVEDVRREREQQFAGSPRNYRAQLHLNLDKEEVSMQVTLPIRHILTFPFLALHSVVGEALEMGLKKAEIRQATRIEDDVKRALKAKWAARLVVEEEVNLADARKNHPESTDKQKGLGGKEEKQSKGIVKRPYPQQPDYSLLPAIRKKARLTPTDEQIPSRPRIPIGPRGLTQNPLRSDTSTHHAHLNRSSNNPPPAPAYVPHQDPQGTLYGRRDYVETQQPEPQSGSAHETERPYTQGGAYCYTGATGGYRGTGTGR